MTWSTIIPWIISLLTMGITASVTIWVTTQQLAAGRLQLFRQKQFELYIQATEAVGRLASETDPVEWETARKTFWRLYWGPLCIVEDASVEAAMVKLGQLVPRKPIENPELPRESSLGLPRLRPGACGKRYDSITPDGRVFEPMNVVLALTLTQPTASAPAH
jgi:hypothetical protein